MDKPTPFFLVPANKFKDSYPEKAKGISFFAFIFTIFIYISMFYIFNLSPSELFNNTKFLFLLSNTLVLIIAVDYGAFSSSDHPTKLHDQLYNEDVMMRRQRSSDLVLVSSSTPSSDNIVQVWIPGEGVNVVIEDVKEKRIVFCNDDDNNNNNNNHRRSRVASDQRKRAAVRDVDCETKLLPRRPAESRRTIKRRDDVDVDNINGCGKNKELQVAVPRTYQRSKSEGVKRVAFDESKNIIRRVESQKYDEPPDDYVDIEEDVVVDKCEDDECGNDDDQYSNLSNEELNKRVEDFIQRFNKQIRQQRDQEVY